MNIEILLWILGVAMVPTLAWAIHTWWVLKEIKKDVEKLLEMHYNPDQYGFGTGQQTKAMENNTRAMNALTHYIMWLAEKQIGETPPPYVGE